MAKASWVPPTLTAPCCKVDVRDQRWKGTVVDPFTRFFTIRSPYAWTATQVAKRRDHRNRPGRRRSVHRYAGLTAVLGLAALSCASSDNSADEASSGDSTSSTAQIIETSTSEAPTTQTSTTQASTTGPDPDSPVDEATDDLFPDVVGVDAQQATDGTWQFNVTLSSPYDSPERYADAWRVVGLDGAVYGERILTHDHANEQPFTRSESGIEIPGGVTEVLVEGRDQLSGWGGETMTYTLP